MNAASGKPSRAVAGGIARGRAGGSSRRGPVLAPRDHAARLVPADAPSRDVEPA